MSTNIPEGYLKDASGRLVPESLVSEIDKLRDSLVKEIVASAQATSRTLAQFKSQATGDINAFIDLSAEKYGVTLGGQKGNVTLTSLDGQFKVQRAISEKIVFDERLQIAKELVDKCIHKWTEGTNDNIRALVEHAFQTDKEGKISTGRIFSLMKLEIKDPDWECAMHAIRDSIQISGSKSYLRIYQRESDGQDYHPIALDISSIK